MNTDGQLIELVEQFSFIYDKKHIDFKNKLAKENAWKTIAEIMQDTAQSVAATEKRKGKTKPSGSGAYHIWPLFNKMRFLDEFYNPRRTQNNVSITSSQNSEQNSEEPSQQSSIWSEEIVIQSEDILDEVMELLNDDSSIAPNEVPAKRKALQEHKENVKSLREKKIRSSKRLLRKQFPGHLIK